MKKFPTLYKKSSTGKTSQWTISADTTSYTVEFGYTDGIKQTTTVQVKEGKNIGKKNETTTYEQTCAEAESKWEKQKDKGYRETIELTKVKPLSPMLAHKYDDYKHKVKWPCYWQPKLDGVRCLAYRQPDGTIVLQSRQGKPFKAMTHIVEAVDKILPNQLVLDGELYIHGEEFQELIHLIKRDEPDPKSVNIEYHIYDIYDTKNPNLSFKNRFFQFNQMIFTNKMKLVKTETINSETDIKIAQQWAEQNGYEGIMLRNADASYKLGHRSHDLLKVKQFQDAEFEIVGGYENKGRQEGQCTLVCKTDNGAEFGVKPEGTDSQRQWYWNNLDKIKGKKMSVRFFSWTTSDHPVPRFPIGVAIRDYE